MPRGKNSNWMRPMLVFGHLLSTSCSCRSYVKSLRVFKRMYIVIRPAAACLQTYVYCHTTCSSYVYCHIDTQAERHADRDNMYIVVCICTLFPEHLSHEHYDELGCHQIIIFIKVVSRLPLCYTNVKLSTSIWE